VEAVRLLLEKGADIRAVDGVSGSVLLEAFVGIMRPSSLCDVVYEGRRRIGGVVGWRWAGV
jgi:hypothetical protein